MKELEERHLSIIYRCSDELRGPFNQQQSFHITLGAAVVRWVNMNNKYSLSKINIDRILNDDGSVFLVLQEELARFESRFCEFEGILTGIMDKFFIYKDKSADKSVRNIFTVIDNTGFLSTDDIRKFINTLVQWGNFQSGFNETPGSINKIIAGLAVMGDIRNFANYCSGTSGIAVEIYERLKSKQTHDEVFYYGEEIKAINCLLSKLLMIVNEVNEYKIVNKDVLEYRENDIGLQFDFAVCDIPQIMGLNRRFKAHDDPRLIYGVPQRSSADWIFIQHLLYHLNQPGKGVVSGTKGTLVRSTEDNIRRGVIYDDLIECVVTLPDNLYEKSNIGTEMIIFNKSKAIDRRNKILFINASKYGYRLNKNQHSISEEGIAKILECYKNGFEEAGYSRFIDLEKLQEYDYRLNPIEYLEFDILKNSLTNSIPLKEIAQVDSGVQISKRDLEVLSMQPTHYYLNIKDIGEGKINYDESSKLTYKKVDWLGKYDLEPGDIVITSKGWTVKVAIVEELKPAFISGNLTRIRIDPEKYNAYVLYEFLQSEIGMKMLEGLQTGTTIKLLNNAQLERLEIPMFDIGFINKIGQEIKESKIQYEKTIEEATRAFEEKREQLMGSLGWRNSKKKGYY